MLLREISFSYLTAATIAFSGIVYLLTKLNQFGLLLAAFIAFLWVFLAWFGANIQSFVYALLDLKSAPGHRDWHTAHLFSGTLILFLCYQYEIAFSGVYASIIFFTYAAAKFECLSFHCCSHNEESRLLPAIEILLSLVFGALCLALKEAPNIPIICASLFLLMRFISHQYQLSEIGSRFLCVYR